VPTRGMRDAWISGSGVNSFCCYGLVYPLDSWLCLRSLLIEAHVHVHMPDVPGEEFLTQLWHQCPSPNYRCAAGTTRL
jgi:hypothetical protein